MSAPILDPSFRWIPAATHGTSEKFAERQRARMKAAEQARKAAESNVKQINQRKAAKA